MVKFVSKKQKTVRLGIVGLGNMGSAHARSILGGAVPDCQLAAVCDENAGAGGRFPGVPFFQDPGEMMNPSVVDAVLIATPHYSHVPLGTAALGAGLHLLMEKPISVHKADCQRLISAYRKRRGRQVFSAMFNQRTDSLYLKIRDLVRGGELGEIRRVNWIITDWFRTEAYYSSGGWRATWAGEGGGVLLNQCPHNLDLYQWIFGMPATVRGFCTMGRYHDIEVEDDVTAYFEHRNGATGVFITSTGESPGTNRLEVAGERGKLVMEGGKLSFTRNEIPMSEFSASSTEGFARPGVWNVGIPVEQHGEQHVGILKNFVGAILRGEELLAPGSEGINSVELGNAILMSSLLGKKIDLPMSGAAYAKLLKKLVAASKSRKKRPVRRVTAEDFGKSYR